MVPLFLRTLLLLGSGAVWLPTLARENPQGHEPSAARAEVRARAEPPQAARSIESAQVKRGEEDAQVGPHTAAAKSGEESGHAFREEVVEGGLEAELEGEGGEEAEDEEHETFSAVDIGVAMTLLGSVALVMTLFHLVNYKDDDIRRYSWSMISSTVSIFTAVLVFHGIHDLVILSIKSSSRHPLLVSTGLFLVLFVAMQVGMAVIVGAHGEDGHVDISQQSWTVADTMRSDYGTKVSQSEVRNLSGIRSVAIIDGLEVYVRKSPFEKETRERRMKGWSLPMAHISGFAAISLGVQLQQLPGIGNSCVLVAASVVAMEVGLLLLFRIAKAIRDFINSTSAEQDERDAMFLEEVEEAENDIMSISLSFLTVQTLRFALTGVLPGLEGLEDGEHAHHGHIVLSLLLIGVALAAGAILLVFSLQQERHSFQRRLLEVLQNQMAMSFAWCVLSAARWQALRTHVFDPLGGVQSVSARIILAVMMSAIAVLAIFGLDTVEDIQKRGKVTDGKQLLKVINCLTNAFGILVGFSWEFCFDGGVAAVASLTDYHVTMKMLMAMVVVVVIIPMWRRHILSKVLMHKQMRLEKLVVTLGSSHRSDDGREGFGHEHGRRSSDPSVRSAALASRPRRMSDNSGQPLDSQVLASPGTRGDVGSGSYHRVPAK